MKEKDYSIIKKFGFPIENTTEFSYPEWPEVFNTKDISGRPDAALCADALVGWGNVLNGNKPHENFGTVMVLISRRLGISSTSESFLKWSFDWLKKVGEETDRKGNPQ